MLLIYLMPKETDKIGRRREFKTDPIGRLAADTPNPVPNVIVSV
jgi:hypothetical protein